MIIECFFKPSLVTLLLLVTTVSSPLLSTSSVTAQDANPAAYWLLEEGSGMTALDSSENGNTGSITGATYTTDTPPLARGVNNSALLFDAKGDFVTIPAGGDTNLDSFASGITLEAFIKPLTLPIPPDDAEQRLKYIIWADDDAYSLSLVSDSDGNTFLQGGINFVDGNAVTCSQTVVAPFSNVRTGTFTHVALTYGSEVLRLYVDGLQVAQASTSSGCGSSVGPVGLRDVVRIGSDETAEGFPSRDRDFRGVIDEVRITGSPLDPSQFLVAIITDGSLLPTDFGPEAERIDFDNLEPGDEVTFQLRMQGVRLQSLDDGPPRVVDATTMTGNPHSAPHAVASAAKGSPLEVLFTSPRNKVGMYVGNLPGPATAVLQAFDLDDNLLEEVSVPVDASSAGDVATFIGLGVPEDVITRVSLDLLGIDAPRTIDDLMVEPAQDDLPEIVETVQAAASTLLFAASTVEEKLDAIGTLQLAPSTSASAALQEAAEVDGDLYVRERAIMALVQLRDPDAIPTLAVIGQEPPSGEVLSASQHAVWALREDFPFPDPPEVIVGVISTIKVDTPVVVEGRILSPVNRDFVQINFGNSKSVSRIRTDQPMSYQGPLVAGQEVVLQATYFAEETGQTALPLTVRVSQSLVDAITYTEVLYLDIQETTGSASTAPFPGWNETIRHIVVEDESVLDLQVEGQGEGAGQGQGKRNELITGTVMFQDGDAGAFLGFTATGTKPGRFVKVEVIGRHSGTEFGCGHTDNTGAFSIRAEDVPENTGLSLLLEIDNFATKLWVDVDAGNEEFVFRPRLRPVNSLSSGTIGFGTVTVDPGTSAYRTITVDENGILPFGDADLSVHFAAAMNINEVILVARDDVQSNRDGRESDSIGQVDVEYCDEGSKYAFSLGLRCGRIDGIYLGPPPPQGFDTGFIDRTIAHEYGHHLQYEISTWDGHAGRHAFCEEIDTTFWNDPEFAWSEGFADYLGEHIVRRKPNMSMVNSRTIEDACSAGGDPNRPTFTDFGDNERFYSIEGHIAATLWDLSDGLGRGSDSWDRVDGDPTNLVGHRRIIQIFDRELNFIVDAADLLDFYEAWVDRTGLDWVDGRPALDSILNRMRIFPGGESSGLWKMTARALIEANPELPSQAAAGLSLPGGVMPQYSPAVYVPPPSDQLTPPPSPTLTIQRTYSYLDGTPMAPASAADEFSVQIGVTNLGSLRMEVDVEGDPGQADSATYSTTIDFTPDTGAPWLSATPTDPSFVSFDMDRTDRAPKLDALTIRFLPAAYLLDRAPTPYQADINVQFTINNRGGPVSVSETIRVNFTVLEGRNDDADQDGLTNAQEKEILRDMDTTRYGCLDPRNRDSDFDQLDDEDERTLGTSPCDRDTDNDGMWDGLEAKHSCLHPLTPDANEDPDGDGLTNAEEVLDAPPTDPCLGDTDGDGVLDEEDNCRLTPNPNQSDIDGDEIGDICDGDIDGDGCSNLFDPNPEDINNPDEDCLDRPLDPALDRRGRIVTGFDQRLYDSQLHAMLKGLLGPQEPGQCGGLDCPGPGLRVFDEDFATVLLDVDSKDFGFTEDHFFGTSSLWVPDRDNDGRPDVAIGVSRADSLDGTEAVGAVLIISSMTGEECCRIEGEPNSGFGTSLALRNNNELIVGAPGSIEQPGSVFIYQLGDSSLAGDYTQGEPGDEFGTSVALTQDDDGDGIEEVLIGAPGDGDKKGAVYVGGSSSPLGLVTRGLTAGDRFGHTVISLGDITKDGRSEVLVGAPGASPEGQGAGQIDNGSQTGKVTIVTLNGERVCTQGGSEANERFGTALAAVATDPSDGHVTNALVGAPGWNNNTGRAYVLGEDCSLLGFFSGEQKGAELGALVAAGPDFDKDGLPSLVVMEPKFFVTGEGVGRTAFYNWHNSSHTPVEADFLRGDPNGDAVVDISDAIFILGCRFLGKECPTCRDAGDTNDDGVVDLSDAITILSFKFLGTPPPPPPALGCGPDPTPDDLPDCEYPRCELDG